MNLFHSRTVRGTKYYIGSRWPEHAMRELLLHKKGPKQSKRGERLRERERDRSQKEEDKGVSETS